MDLFNMFVFVNNDEILILCLGFFGYWILYVFSTIFVFLNPSYNPFYQTKNEKKKRTHIFVTSASENHYVNVAVDNKASECDLETGLCNPEPSAFQDCLRQEIINAGVLLLFLMGGLFWSLLAEEKRRSEIWSNYTAAMNNSTVAIKS